MKDYNKRNYYSCDELFNYIESSLAGARDTYNSFAKVYGRMTLNKEAYERIIRSFDKMFDKINPWSTEFQMEEASEPFVMPRGGEAEEYIF